MQERVAIWEELFPFACLGVQGLMSLPLAPPHATHVRIIPEPQSEARYDTLTGYFEVSKSRPDLISVVTYLLHLGILETA